MTLQTLGYIGLRTKNLEDWTAYASRFLGMQLVDKSRGTATFRMDDRKQRLVVRETPSTLPASTAGRSPTPPRSTLSARGSSGTRCRSRAARARSPRSAR